jgi:hypothetical protein
MEAEQQEVGRINVYKIQVDLANGVSLTHFMPWYDEEKLACLFTMYMQLDGLDKNILTDELINYP